MAEGRGQTEMKIIQAIDLRSLLPFAACRLPLAVCLSEDGDKTLKVFII
jgi:hypothetical protein